MQPPDDSSLNAKPAEQQAIAALDRVLAGRSFKTAGTQARLLRYIVEKTVAGSGGELKEAVIAIEVFGRTSFDSRSDSIVRVEARKLRDTLARHYASEGAADPLVISIPKGGYAATFETRIPQTLDAPPPPPPPRTRKVWIGSAIVAVTLIAGAWATLLRNAPSAVAPPGRLQSIAVLPFLDLGGGDQNAYLADGLAEQLTDVLSRVEGLRVVSRTSAFRFRTRGADPRQVGKALNVDTLLEGSVQRVGSKIRVVAQLIQAETGFHLWSRSYDRELDNVIAVEEDLARQIVFTFHSHVANRDEVLLSLRYPASPKAYEQYLKGLYAYDRNSKDGLERSIVEYRSALQLDPAYTPALNALAASYVALGIYGFWRPVDSVPMARDAATRALKLDPDSDVAHAMLGFCASTYEWDWEAANAEFRKAIQLNPNCATCRAWFSFYYLSTHHKSEEAYQQLAKAIELDPLDPRFQSFRIAIPNVLREYDRAIEEGHRALTQNSNDYMAHLFLGLALRQTGRYAEALEEDLQTAKLTNYTPLALRNLGDLYGATGRKQEAEAMLHRLEEIARHGYVSPVIFAIVYSSLGDSGRTFDWLDRAIAEHDLYLIFLESGPLYDRWKSDARFQAILRRVGLL